MEENYIKNQFVTYEIASELKELGFDEECLAFYKNDLMLQHQFDFEDNTFTIQNSKLSIKAKCAAPLWQQVIDWLLSEKNISLYVGATFISGYTNPFWSVTTPTYYYMSEKVYSGFSNTLLEAKEQSILKAIELCKKEIRTSF